MTETDSDITRSYRGYRGYNAGTRDYDSITRSIGGKEREREGIGTIGLD